MSDYFDASQNRIVAGSLARSAEINALRDETGAGFDRLPDPVEIKDGTITFGINTLVTGNAYDVVMPDPRTAYNAGMTVTFVPIQDNTGAVTLNIDGLGVQGVKRPDGSDLKANDFSTGLPLTLTYNGTHFSFTGGTPHSFYEDAVASAAAALVSELAAQSSEDDAQISEDAARVSELAAAASKVAAQTARTGAETARAGAETAETAAQSSEDDAQISEDAARVSELAAKASEVAAQSSEDDAQISENNAANSAAAALTSKGQAATSAAQALASKNAAGVSETNAASSASAALTSQNAASTSATQALASKNAAAGSATAANTSKNQAAASAGAAAASYDSFDDRYLGSKASDPSVDNDGAALLEGATYWNSTIKAMKAWNGSIWSVNYNTLTWVNHTTHIAALAMHGYMSYCSAASTITLPANPSLGDTVMIKDAGLNAPAANLTIARNGKKIENADADYVINKAGDYVELVYGGGTPGWWITSKLYGYSIYK